MPYIPRRHSHFIFGVVQSGLTCMVATGITSAHLIDEGAFLRHWLLSWLSSWTAMLPVVLIAAPGIQQVTLLLTRDDK